MRILLRDDSQGFLEAVERFLCIDPKVEMTVHDNQEYRTQAEAVGADGYVSESEIGS